MTDYLETAKAITRHFFPTPAWTRDLNQGRPSCSSCQVPMKWSRDGICPSCTREEFYQRFTLTKKETK